MDSTIVGTYNNQDVYLIEDGEYSIAFGSLKSEWISLYALNKILRDIEDYIFKTKLANGDEITVKMTEFEPLLAKINDLVA